MEKESLITFPCEFPVKIMGRNVPEFEISVVEIFNRHVDDLSEDAVRSRPSKNGNYLALTIMITAQSQDQLDNIYRELSDSKLVTMAL